MDLFQLLTFLLAVIMITFAVDIKDAADSKDGEPMSSVVYTIVVLIVVLLFLKFLLDFIFVYAVYKVPTCAFLLQGENNVYQLTTSKVIKLF